MPRTYDRIVQAAIDETSGKFALAEALALDIPPRRRGPTADDEESVSLHLAAARERIIAAGGEPKSVDTLREYRLTALWVCGGNTTNFGWLPGVSFTSHNEARRSGVAYEDFARNPRTARALREERGAGSKDAGPERAIQSWSPAQKAVALTQLVADPTVLVQDDAQEAIVNAAAASPRLTTQVNERAAERRPAPTPSRPETALDFAALLGISGGVEMAVRRAAERSAELVTWLRTHRVDHRGQEAVREEIGRLRESAEALRESLRRAAVEIELALGDVPVRR